MRVRVPPPAAALLTMLATCGGPPDVAPVPGAPIGVEVPLVDGLGTHRFAITTTSAAAQRYFEQGLRLVYASEHDRALRSFRQAQRLDAAAPMPYWGEALALSPSLRRSRSGRRDAEAHRTLERAEARLAQASRREHDFVGVMLTRFTPGSPEGWRDTVYARSARWLMETRRGDPDAAALWAEARMLLPSSADWTPQGEPYVHTDSLRAALEGVLTDYPDHPGALYHYVMLMQGSNEAGRAEGAADRLRERFPSAPHLLHAPAGIYHRLGRYRDAVETSEQSIAAERRYGSSGAGPYSAVGASYESMYIIACLVGRERLAREAAEALGRMASDGVSLPVPWGAAPLLVLVRFGRWRKVLEATQTPETHGAASAFAHFARGMALLAAGRLDEAVRERAALVVAASTLPAEGRRAPGAWAEIASHILAGEVAAKRGDVDRAVLELGRAVEREDELTGLAPSPWPLPARHYLGAVLLGSRRLGVAQRVFGEDLRRNPENGWSLYGLWQAVEAEGRSRAAAEIRARFRRAWRQADVELTGSRF